MLENSFSWISGNWQNGQKINVTWHCFCDFIMNCLTNSYFILQIRHAKTFECGIPCAGTIILSKDIHENAGTIAFHGFTSFANFVNFQKSMKSYFPAFLWISLDRIIVQASNTPHFKGFDMRNLQYDIRICQKTHHKVTISMSIW